MLIIDANALSAVFNRDHDRHNEYAAILQFVVERRGILISGGTHYLRELRCFPRIFDLFVQLQRAGQVRIVLASEVDAEEVRVARLAPAPGCDDQHLIALVIKSGARVIASDDRRADRYLKDKALYPRGIRRPSIYRSSKHSRLLVPLPRLQN